MKKTFIFLLIIQAAVFSAQAQIGYNYAQYGIGFGAGYLHAGTDVPYQQSYPSANINLNYNVTPYFTLSVEYQFGSFAGGYSYYYTDKVKALNPLDTSYATSVKIINKIYKSSDPYLRSYSSTFQTIAFHADLQAGEVFDLSDDHFVTKALKNFYVGSGVGLVYSKVTSINRYSPDSSYYYGGSDESQEIVIPLRVGYQFKVYNAYDEPSVTFNIGYEYNYVMGYGLDGYSDPLLVSQRFQKYGGFNFGVKFNFGTVTSYRKPLH